MTVYEVVSPKRDTVVTKTVATGNVEPRYEVEIKPQISGIIAELRKEAGQMVKEGEIIATIKVIPEMVQLNSAESRVNVAEISLKQVEETYKRDVAAILKITEGTDANIRQSMESILRIADRLERKNTNGKKRG